MVLEFFKTNRRMTEAELVTLEFVLERIISLFEEINLSQDEREDVLLNALSLVRGENKWV